MKTSSWFLQLSGRQRFWLFAAASLMLALIAVGFLMNPVSNPEKSTGFNLDMSIRQIAPELGITGKALARELKLPLDVSKTDPLRDLGVTREKLQHVVHHILSHVDAGVKYYLYAALVLGALVFLIVLGRPEGSSTKQRRAWYPRFPYIFCLLVSVVVAGFLLGKSPNPMEGIVKVLKSMVGLYPDPIAKAAAFGFFIILAVVGNKVICGWGCPFGALQELIFSLPILRKMKDKKMPFIVTNTIRTGLFVAMVFLLIGVIGNRKGMVIYHFINPFNLFNLDFETGSILLTIVIVLSGSFFFYRPFCQFICPFGLASWIAERLSIFAVRIDRNKCTQCGACIKACPLEAAKGRVAENRFPADCFSCARCLNVCPVDAIQYRSDFKKGRIG